MSNVSLIDGHIDEPKITNYDRIKNMSVEEMAEFIVTEVKNILKEDEGMFETALKAWIKRLESEVQGE